MNISRRMVKLLLAVMLAVRMLCPVRTIAENLDSGKALENIVLNNGGQAVGYKGWTYYWRYHEGSVGNEGMFGYTPNVDGEINDLVARDVDGNEEVIFSEPGYGPLFITGDRIYYQEKYLRWWSVALNGANPKPLPDGAEVLASDAVSGTAIYRGTGGTICSEDKNREQHVLLNPDNIAAGSSGGMLDISDSILYCYLYNPSNRAITIYGYDLISGESREIGSSAIELDYMEGMVFGGKVHQDSLYVSCLTRGGTGAVYNNGCILSFSLTDGSVLQLVDDNDRYPQMYEDLYFTRENGTDYLYYFGGSGGTSNFAVLIAPWFEEGVAKLNLENRQVEGIEDPWIQYGSYAYYNGELVTRADESSPALTTVISAGNLNNLGYPALNQEQERCCFVRNFSLVGDTAWIEISDLVRDNSLSLGWRQGYRRMSTRLYCTKIGTDEVQLIGTY